MAEDYRVTRTVLNFSESNIPQECYTILSIELNHKIAKERLPLLANNISAVYIANGFRVECFNVLQKERTKKIYKL